MKRAAIAIFVAATCISAERAFADQGPLFSGHGPVFGMTTPTNAQDAWAVDIGFMGRKGEDETGSMLRTMFSYGITEDLQLSWSLPFVFGSAPLAPARTTAMMPGTPDIEAIVAWRFHRQGVQVGTRFESTAYGGLIVPGPQRLAGMARDLERAPGVYTAIATGIASRSHYVWGGVGYTRFGENDGDQRPDIFSYSGVWGYRPPALRKDYPHWDWRLFVEMTGERAGNLWNDNVEHVGTGGHQIFLGPGALGIYKNYAIEGGIQFPVYRDIGRFVQEEDFRFALNFSYFF